MKFLSVKTVSIALCALFLISCGSTKLAINMNLVSTSTDISKTDVKKENRTTEVSTFYFFGIPLGEEATPQAAFNKLNDNAICVTDMGLKQSGWYFWELSTGTYLIGKKSWKANGTAVIENK
jgi:hypothetical protein